MLLVVWLPAKSQKDFYIKNGKLVDSIRLNDLGEKSNGLFITGKKIFEDLQFYPDQIDSYGFADGDKYFSKEIVYEGNSRKFFFKLVYDEKTTLYYLDQPGYPQFFIENDKGGLTAIPKRIDENTSYNSRLLKITEDCKKLENACKRVPYRSESMIRLFEFYDKCSGRPFPHFSYGVMAGYRTHEPFKPALPERHLLTYFEFENKTSAMAGVFIENPISVSDVSVHAEAYLTWEENFAYFKSENLDLDLQTSALMLNIPLMLRYTFPLNKLTAYLNGGVIYTRNFGAKSTLISLTKRNSQIYFVTKEDVSGQIYDKSYMTFTYGAGIKLYITYKNFIFLEFRRNAFRGISTRNTININEFQIVSGISL